MMATPGPVTEIQDDRLAGMRLMTGERISIGTQPLSEDELCAEIDRADLVISSRFHGCVLSAMAGVPFVGVGSHAKFEGYFEERGWKNYVPLEQLDQETFEVALRALPAPEEMCRDREEGRAWWDANSRTIRDALFT
jgi:polysaccharide pyruvyl transferase WcaK-like protein